MSGLETAIRNALDKSERSNPETRARIYQSARSALEAGLRKQNITDQRVITEQRHRLESTIRDIEEQERAALGVIDPEIRLTDEDDQSVDGGLDSVVAERADEPAAYAAPAAETRGNTHTVEAVRAVKPVRKKRRPFFSLLLVIATLLAAFGAAAWWVQSSGLLKSAAERDTGVANPPAQLQPDSFDGNAGPKPLAGQAGFTGDWVPAYTPGDARSVETRGSARVEIVNDDTGQAARITSTTADQNGEVLIPIPAAVLGQMAGKTSTLALTVKSANGKPTQFYVECEFSTLGSCERHRFNAADERIDMLFQVTFSQTMAPTTPGHLVINSDVSGGGNALDLFSVRVLPGS